MAEGTPLERVQVVNSGARVQIPPSPLAVAKQIPHSTLTNEQQCNPEDSDNTIRKDGGNSERQKRV